MELYSTRITSGVHCLQIRHKGMFVNSAPTTPEEDASGLYDADSYWCGKTAGAFGPDGQPARPDICRASRRCCDI